MKIIFLVLCFVFFASVCSGTETFRHKPIKWNANVIDCKFAYGQLSGFEIHKDNKSSKLYKDSFECPLTDPGCKVTFKNLNSENPQMISTGSGDVTIIEKSKVLPYLLISESTPSGTLNLFRIELETGLIVETKNCVDPFFKGRNYGAIYAGQCESR